MSMPYVRKNVITASGLIERGAGNFYGVVVNSHTSGTIKVWDNTSAAGDVILDTITFAAGSGIQLTFPFGINFSTGLFITVGGTASYTILWGQLDR